MAFQYKVRDSLGKVQDGTIIADSEQEATQKLRQGGFQVMELSEADDDLAMLFPRRISRAALIYMTSQLAIMVDTGITLSAALGGIMEQEENPSLKKILKELKEAVEGGEDFSSALARYPKHFDKTYVSMVRASEATGSMGEMLQRVANYLRKDLETRSKVRAAMAYPTVMMVLALGVTIFLLTYVLPKFTPLFTRKGITLPAPTVLMMTLSDLMLNYWMLWLGAGVGAVVAFVFGRRTEPGRKLWDGLKIHTPIFGPMVRKVVISRSIRTLGTMIVNGVAMLDALQLSAEVAGNYYFESLWKRVATEVTGGSQICESLARDRLFPRMLIQMISAGEQTGHLGPVLEKISDYYDQEVETSLKTVTSMIEPLMITVMGFVVGGIGLALLLPIFTLSRTPG